MGISVPNYKRKQAKAAAPAEVPTPVAAPAAPVAAPAPAPAPKAAPTAPAASAAPSGPTQAQRDAAARRRREQEEADRRRAEEEKAAQEAAAQEAGPPMPELAPFGNVDTSDFIRGQALAIQNDPMVIARKMARSDNVYTHIPASLLTGVDPIDVERDQYALDVYKKAAAREDLLRAIRPDSELMAAAPEFKTPQGAALYRNAAKAQALKTLIEAKRQAPSFEVEATFFETDLMDPAVPFDDPDNPKSMKRHLDAQLDLLTAPSIRPYPVEEEFEILNPYDRSTEDLTLKPLRRSMIEQYRKAVPAKPKSVMDYVKQLDENYRMRGGVEIPTQEETRATAQRMLALSESNRAKRDPRTIKRVPIPDKGLISDEELTLYFKEPGLADMIKNARDLGETELVYTQATDTSAN
tara:strand:- start:10578 stop:11807 length:1230 start_codon:yes stop_codon:yes gene_type:complete